MVEDLSGETSVWWRTSALKRLYGGGPGARDEGLVALDGDGNSGGAAVAGDHGDAQRLGAEKLLLLLGVGGGGDEGGAGRQLGVVGGKLGVGAQRLGQLTQLDGGRLQRAVGLHLQGRKRDQIQLISPEEKHLQGRTA